MVSSENSNKNILPILPLRDIVVFPRMIVPLFVGREKSVTALYEVMNNDKQIMLVSQKDSAVDDPKSGDVYKIGTVSSVLQLLKLPDGTVKVLVEGGSRAKIVNFTDNENFLEAEVETIEEKVNNSEELEALQRTVVVQFEQYIKLNKKIPPEVLVSISQIDDPNKLADAISSHLPLKIAEKQELLETESINERLELVFGHMEAEISVLQVEKRIRRRVKKQMEKSQRDYYLNEQLKAIQKELGEEEDGNEIEELTKKIKKTPMSKEAKEKAQAELKKLKHMSPMSAEATVIRNFLDWVLGLPWKKHSKIRHDIAEAQKILDTDHYGLEKVKERIVEFLAVQNKTKKVRGPILCLVGPPGVGKTSLGESIARATGRNFVRASLGGMRDEAEIRGHRRTYIGSMPGKIIKCLRKAKTSNPLFLLDEVDKLGNDWRGDPSSALLEVLDPEQNATFNDHYLEIDYDLSEVMFITTANTLKMPKPLLDRMEIIRISGYTEEEKVQIAIRHLIPKHIKACGLNDKEISISETAVRDAIRYYTKESGVRNLEREMAKLCRKVVKELLLTKVKSVSITTRNLSKFLGVKKYSFGQIEKKDLVGITTGMAWTEVGGELLSIEALTMPGKGRIIHTGQLGDVMKESIEAARSYVKANAFMFGLKSKNIEKYDIHIHVPEGATPKDGPSAGVAMCTSLVSCLTKIPVKKDVAMTGEITLRGRVLPIGGLKEKMLAALRGGIKTVLIPKENEKDLEEIPDNVKEGLKIIPVSYIEEVLKNALTAPLAPIPWTDIEEDDDEDKAKVVPLHNNEEDDAILTH
ncbi:MAG: endopeptidase La [Alphaproteobacteria bacterium]